MDKTTLSMRMRDPSEKIHSQIRRPSFSDSLLTRIRRESLRGRRNTIWGPNVHFHAPAVFQIRKCFRHPVKIRSVGQTISFARRRREGVAGAQYMLCRGRSVSRLSPGPSLQVFARHHSDNMQWGAKAQRPLRKVLRRDSGAGKPSHSCNPAQYDDIVRIMIRDIFPIPMRKVKGNSGSPPSSAGGRKRVPEGASGPS